MFSSTFARELLAIYLVIKHFHYFVEGQSFHILIDHNPLTYALATTQKDKQGSQFNSEIRQVKVAHNPVTDALSRADISAVAVSDESPPVIDFKAIAAARNNDPDIKHLWTGSPLKIQAVLIAMSDATILCDVSTGTTDWN